MCSVRSLSLPTVELSWQLTTAKRSCFGPREASVQRPTPSFDERGAGSFCCGILLRLRILFQFVFDLLVRCQPNDFSGRQVFISPNMRASSFLRDAIEVALDWDVPDGDVAKRFMIRHPPGNGLFVIAQYRKVVEAKHQFGSDAVACNEHQFIATQVRSGVVNVSPRGPLGICGVYVKPEAAMSAFGSLKEFANAKIDLRDIFRPSELDRLQELLAKSTGSSQRIAHMEAFLARNARCTSTTSVAQEAAKLLRCRPSMRRARLAGELGVSERHLTRVFQQSFGVSPKRFAKIARVEKALAGRRDGLTWAEVAHMCDFYDQSHMVRDFKEITGQSPGEFFRPLKSGAQSLVGGANLTFAVSETQ
jgi:AraC-like DNA-binding protein